MKEGDVGKVFPPGVAEDAALENMGYRPGKLISSYPYYLVGALSTHGVIFDHLLISIISELKRSFGLLGMIGFSFSIVTR